MLLGIKSWICPFSQLGNLNAGADQFLPQLARLQIHVSAGGRTAHGTDPGSDQRALFTADQSAHAGADRGTDAGAPPFLTLCSPPCTDRLRSR